MADKLQRPSQALSNSAKQNITLTHWQGVTPPPEILSQYEELYPGAARQIIDQGLAQTSHRIDIEKIVIKGNARQSLLGQIFALIIGLTGIICGTVLVLYGHDWAGGSLCTASVGGLATTFIVGKNTQRKELQSKRKNIEE